MQNETPERDLPVPKYEIVKMTMDETTEHGHVKQWLVKTQHKHLARIIHPVKDGKVKPPSYGSTDHVLVTTRTYKMMHKGESVGYEETTVYASDKDGDFFNAVMYAATKELELWEVMFAIGEI